MSSTFQFGFSGDDVGDEDLDIDSVQPLSGVIPRGFAMQPSAPTESIKPQRHSLQEFLDNLPSKISFSTLSVTSTHGHKINLPRRELFDVRMQLMAEDDSPHRREQKTESIGPMSLGSDDIRRNVYEGGFKSWECSIDLVRLLLDDESYSVPEGPSRVIELGAGTSLPSLVVIQQLLRWPRRQGIDVHRFCHLTIADYNYDVLRLVSFPNILLSWALTKSILNPWPQEGDLDITSELLDAFKTDVHDSSLRMDAISGAWGDDFVRLLEQSVTPGPSLVFASETIYSPATLPSFTKVLSVCLSPGEYSAKALVAAKKFYFGVGGGIDEFRQHLNIYAATNTVVKEMETDGVARIILEVRR